MFSVVFAFLVSAIPVVVSAVVVSGVVAVVVVVVSGIAREGTRATKNLEGKFRAGLIEAHRQTCRSPSSHPHLRI